MGKVMKKSYVLSVLKLLTVFISSGTNAEFKALSTDTEALSNEAVKMDTLTFRGKTYYLVFTEE